MIVKDCNREHDILYEVLPQNSTKEASSLRKLLVRPLTTRLSRPKFGLGTRKFAVSVRNDFIFAEKSHESPYRGPSKSRILPSLIISLSVITWIVSAQHEHSP